MNLTNLPLKGYMSTSFVKSSCSQLDQKSPLHKHFRKTKKIKNYFFCNKVVKYSERYC